MSYRLETPPTRMELLLGRLEHLLRPQDWTIRSAAVVLAFVVVVGTLGCSVKQHRDSADAWHRRAVASEEIVGGLRVVIGERSQALNQRTKQANELAGRLGLTRTALSRSRVSVGTLTRRQRQLARENARADAALRKQRAALRTSASQLSACTQSLGPIVNAVLAKKPKAVPANARSRLARCTRARASLDAYLERFG
jgi:hypothetical protein